VGTIRFAIGRARAGFCTASVMLMVTTMAIIATPPTPAGGTQSSHGLTSPPTVTASTWQPTTTQDPAGNSSLGTRGVSCATSTFCVSVGWYYVGAQAYPKIQQWNGSTWTTVTPNVTPQFNFVLDGVSCVSATFCAAVGYTQSSHLTGELPLAMTWNGSSWSQEAPPLPAGQAGGLLSSVSCLSATWCLAVGDSTPTIDFRTGQVAGSVQWNGSQWGSVVTAPNPVA